MAWTTGAAGWGQTRTEGARGTSTGGRYTPSPLTGISRAYSADRQARFVWLLWHLAPTRKAAGHWRYGSWRSSCSFSPWFSVWYFSGNDKEKDHRQACRLERADHFQINMLQNHYLQLLLSTCWRTQRMMCRLQRNVRLQSPRTKRRNCSHQQLCRKLPRRKKPQAIGKVYEMSV